VGSVENDGEGAQVKSAQWSFKTAPNVLNAHGKKKGQRDQDSGIRLAITATTAPATKLARKIPVDALLPVTAVVWPT
jgi:hypothetical protein